MIVAVAILCALACILASAWRLWLVTHPTGFDPDELVAWLDGGRDLDELARVIAEEPSADWERDLVAALRDPRTDARISFVNEQLGELDYRMQRWLRVPRVCASIASSFGIMLGTLVLRRGVAEAPDLTTDLGQLFIRDLVGDAISVASFGIVATAFCIGAHSQAARLARERLAAADKLVERLEALSGVAAYR